MSFPTPGDNPLAEHARHFPRCPFIMGEDVGNQPIDDDPIRGPKRHLRGGYDVCGNFTPNRMHSLGVNARNFVNKGLRVYVNTHRPPTNVDYMSIDARMSSFMSNKWSPNVPVDTKALAEAGFYSVGRSDYVKCFYCDGGLSNWEVGDDPWIEHAKNFPECQFVILNKSQAFIEECRRLVDNGGEQQSTPNPQEVPDPELYSPVGSDDEEEDIDTLGVTAVNEWMNSDIVLQLIDLNAFPEEVIRTVLFQRWRREKQPFSSFAHLYDAVSQWKGPASVQMYVNQRVFLKAFLNICFVGNSTRRPVPNSLPNSDSENEYINSISEEENSGNELPSSQSSTTSTLSTYSQSPPEYVASPEVMSSPEGSLKSENNILLCKICLDREIGVVFLPCGHQLACTQCALCLTDCPVCRKVIRGTVRTFFS